MNPPTAAARAPARSYLFVPGDRPDRFDKAWDSQADEVVLDLEDAVAPDRKATARAAIAGWLDASRPVWVRVNAVDTPWFADDLSLGLQPGIAGLMLPKADEIPADMVLLCQERSIGILPIVESASGIRAAQALAATPAVVRLAFGALDFQADLGISGDDDALLFFRSQLVLASRLAGRASPIDGITPSIDDAEQLRLDTQRSRRLGFGAKLCIHPRQIAAVHLAFSPSDDERQWAARVLAAMEASGGAVAALDGRMIDRPVALKAARIAQAPPAESRLPR